MLYAKKITVEYQGGFRRGRSAADQVFTMREILGNCWEQNIEVHQLFIDFQAAYDNIEKGNMK